jgi:hypothetical protein
MEQLILVVMVVVELLQVFLAHLSRGRAVVVAVDEMAAVLAKPVAVMAAVLVV